MAEPSFFEVAFEEAQNLLQTEADGFGITDHSRL